jgi:hypothetical protein
LLPLGLSQPPGCWSGITIAKTEDKSSALNVMNTPLNNKSSDPTDLNGQLEQVGQIIRMLDGEFVGEKRRAGKFEDRQSVETGLLSFVIPAYDEEETLGQLYEGIAANIPAVTSMKSSLSMTEAKTRRGR